MGLFSFTQEIAIDLGTANTIIICDDKVVVDEPSVVAISSTDRKMVAVGRKAQQMIGKGGTLIHTVRPLRDGVIADFYACEMMIRGMIKMIPKQNRLFSPNIRMVVCIPSGSTEVEIRAVRDSSEHAGGRDVYMIYEPMAAAIGMGIDVESPEGCMVVDIGGGTTEIAVISLGGIVANKSIKVAGDDLNADIVDYMGRMSPQRVFTQPTFTDLSRCFTDSLKRATQCLLSSIILTLSRLPITLSISVPRAVTAAERLLPKVLPKRLQRILIPLRVSILKKFLIYNKKSQCRKKHWDSFIFSF